MNGVFDLGGTDGMGAVNPPAHEPVFHAEWEKAAMTMFPAAFRAGWFGLDQFRHGIEKMDPTVRSPACLPSASHAASTVMGSRSASS